MQMPGLSFISRKENTYCINDDDNTIEPGKPVLGKEGDEAYSLDSKGNNKSSSIYIFAGHFVIKGRWRRKNRADNGYSELAG